MRNSLKIKRIIKVLICVIWLGMIFYNGSRPGEVSQKTSKEVIKVASKVINIKTTKIDESGINFSDINYYVRKNAHFFQYFIFGILLCNAIREFKLFKTSEIFLLLFILLFFPVLDELMQKYITGRTSNIFDIVIDFGGGLLAVLISNISYRFIKSFSSKLQY